MAWLSRWAWEPGKAQPSEQMGHAQQLQLMARERWRVAPARRWWAESATRWAASVRSETQVAVGIALLCVPVLVRWVRRIGRRFATSLVAGQGNAGDAPSVPLAGTRFPRRRTASSTDSLLHGCWWRCCTQHGHVPTRLHGHALVRHREATANQGARAPVLACASRRAKHSSVGQQDGRMPRSQDATMGSHLRMAAQAASSMAGGVLLGLCVVRPRRPGPAYSPPSAAQRTRGAAARREHPRTHPRLGC